MNLEMTRDRRRDNALLALVGGSVAMTVFAGCALWLVQGYAYYAFWMGIFALAIILVCLTALGGLLVRRQISLSKEGISINDSESSGHSDGPNSTVS